MQVRFPHTRKINTPAQDAGAQGVKKYAWARHRCQTRKQNTLFSKNRIANAPNICKKYTTSKHQKYTLGQVYFKYAVPGDQKCARKKVYFLAAQVFSHVNSIFLSAFLALATMTRLRRILTPRCLRECTRLWRIQL